MDRDCRNPGLQIVYEYLIIYLQSESETSELLSIASIESEGPRFH